MKKQGSGKNRIEKLFPNASEPVKATTKIYDIA